MELIKQVEAIQKGGIRRLTQLRDDDVLMLEVINQAINAHRLGYLHDLVEDLKCSVQSAHETMEALYEQAHQGQMDLFEK